MAGENDVYEHDSQFKDLRWPIEYKVASYLPRKNNKWWRRNKKAALSSY